MPRDAVIILLRKLHSRFEKWILTFGILLLEFIGAPSSFKEMTGGRGITCKKHLLCASGRAEGVEGSSHRIPEDPQVPNPP